MVFEFEKERYGRREHGRGQQLSHGHESPKVADVRVGYPEEFRENPEDGIPSEECHGNHSRCVPYPRYGPKDAEQDGSFEKRFQKRGRKPSDSVDRHCEGSSVGGESVEFAVHVVGNASEHDADRQNQRDFVRGDEEVFLRFLRVRPHADDYADDASVEAHSALPSLGNLQGVCQIVREVVKKHVSEPASKKNSEEDVEKKVVDLAVRNDGALYQDRVPEQERQGVRGSVVSGRESETENLEFEYGHAEGGVPLEIAHRFGLDAVDDVIAFFEAFGIEPRFLDGDREEVSRFIGKVGDVRKHDGNLAESLREENHAFLLGIEGRDVCEYAALGCGKHVYADADVLKVHGRAYESGQPRILEAEEGVFHHFFGGVFVFCMDAAAGGDDFPVLIERYENRIFGARIFAFPKPDFGKRGDASFRKVGDEHFACGILKHGSDSFGDGLLEFHEFFLGSREDFVFFPLDARVDVSERIESGEGVELVVREFREEPEKRHEDVDDDDDSDEGIDHRIRFAEIHEEHYRRRRGHEESGKTRIDRKDGVPVIGKDFGDEHDSQGVQYHVQYEHEDNPVDIDRVHVHVERYYEDEEQYREREGLSKGGEPFLVLVGKNQRIHEKRQVGRNHDGEESDEREDVGKNSRRSDFCRPEEQERRNEDDESSHEARNEASERGEPYREEVDFRRSEKIFRRRLALVARSRANGRFGGVIFEFRICVHGRNGMPRGMRRIR